MSDSLRPAEKVRLGKKAGYDLIKFWGAPSGAARDSVLATARQVGLPIAGHAPENDNNLLAIQMGYASVEHMLGFGFGGNKTKDVDDAQLRATATALKEAGVWVCPTLNHILQSFTLERAVLYRAIKIFRDVGVGLLAGTDGIGAFQSEHRLSQELEILVTAGLTPYEALAAATRNPAAYFETLDSTGTVAVQKRADLVLLPGNPLEDIRYTAQPVGVMVGGRWLPRGQSAGSSSRPGVGCESGDDRAW
jgi:imidazolonepropionase-like amidohydrolase